MRRRHSATRAAGWLLQLAFPVTFVAALAFAPLPLFAGSDDLELAKTQMKAGSDAAREGLWREAMFRFQRAVQIDPNNAMALNNLGVAYEYNGDYEKAREVYLQALRLEKSNPYIQKNYSRFSEFYTKFKKRDAKPTEAEAKPVNKEAKP